VIIKVYLNYLLDKTIQNLIYNSTIFVFFEKLNNVILFTANKAILENYYN